MAQSKQDAIPQARALYAQGLTVEDVASSVGVSAATIRRWRAADSRDGRDWDAARTERRARDPQALIAIIEDRLNSIARDREMPDGMYADALFKLQRVLQSVRETYRDTGSMLYALQGFASWCSEHLTDDELAIVSRAVDGYLSDIKGSAE
jgi:transposase